MSIPFRDGGRGWRGADCFGLYLLVLAREAGVRLADHDVSYGRDAVAVVTRIEAEIAAGRWLRVEAPARFDAVWMTGHIRTAAGVVRGDVHIGVALGDGRVLHTESQTGPQIMRLDDPRVARRIRGFYRPVFATNITQNIP